MAKHIKFLQNRFSPWGTLMNEMLKIGQCPGFILNIATGQIKVDL